MTADLPLAGEAAARSESAPAAGSQSARGRTPGIDGRVVGTRVAEPGNSGDQRLRVRVAGPLEHVVDGAVLDRRAGVHDEHVLRRSPR